MNKIEYINIYLNILLAKLVNERIIADYDTARLSGYDLYCIAQKREEESDENKTNKQTEIKKYLETIQKIKTIYMDYIDKKTVMATDIETEDSEHRMACRNLIICHKVIRTLEKIKYRLRLLEEYKDDMLRTAIEFYRNDRLDCEKDKHRDAVLDKLKKQTEEFLYEYADCQPTEIPEEDIEFAFSLLDRLPTHMDCQNKKIKRLRKIINRHQRTKKER